MNDVLTPLGFGLAAGAVGLATGWAFFGALWLTTRRLPTRRRPWLWLATSLALRFGGTAAVFVGLARTVPAPALLIAGALFLAPRWIWLRRARRPEPDGAAP